MENILWYKSPASIFEEALPIGNGKMGAMVYGKYDTERISLNEDSLWSGYPSEEKNPGAYEAYLKAKELFVEGKKIEAQNLLMEEFSGRESHSYLPAGNLYVKSDCEDVSDYKRSLDLKTAVAVTRYNLSGYSVISKTFISALDNVLVHSIESSTKRNYEIYMDSQLQYNVRESNGILILNGRAPAQMDYSDYTCTYDDHPTVNYTIALKPESDGEICFKNNRIYVESSSYLNLYLSIKTSYVSWNSKPDGEHCMNAMMNVQNASGKGVQALERDHAEDFASLYGKAVLSLSETESTLPTDERIRTGKKDTGLVELFFNFGKYLVISSSRKNSLSSNLQGIWSEKLFAEWHSGYTVNINTEMNYWPVLMCGLNECFEPLEKLIAMIRESGRTTAKEYYNISKGFTAHHNIDIWGKTSPSEGIARWMYWNMTPGWMCRHLFEYYEYTKDIEFLKTTAFPTMYEAAEFYMDIIEKIDGINLITPSTSPENAYLENGKETFLAGYTTMTQSILSDLFANLIKACDILGFDEMKDELSEKYPPESFCIYKTGSKGQLLEYNEEYEEQDIHHRHVSHLYGLYPGESITSDDKCLSDACRKSLEIRGDGGTGWSLGWKINLWAKLKDGNHALKILKRQLSFVDPANSGHECGGVYANLFDAHPPFQIDGNFGAVAGICQMLLQCENGVIKILPALPDEFSNGCITDLKAKGNISVSIWWKSGKAEKIILSSPFNQKVTLNVCNGKNFEIELKNNESYLIESF